MFPFVSLRRIKFLLLSNGTKRRDRTLHSPQDCLENAPQKKYSFLKIFLLACLGAVLLYLFFYRSPVVPTHPYLEVFPGDKVKLITEKVSMTDVFTYEKDPHKIKKDMTQAEQRVAATPNLEVLALAHVLAKQKTLPVCISRIRTQNITIHTAKNKTQDTLNMIVMGGYYTPRDCRSRHKVGILVPYRDRAQNLAVFLYNMHPFLIRQKLEYRIFLLEQYGIASEMPLVWQKYLVTIAGIVGSDLVQERLSGTEPFNRGRLFNAGFLEIQKMGDWPCVVFHDVDLLPTDDRILYTCPNIPRHMCATVLEKKHLANYRTLFGGVAAMTKKQFRKVNGYSNMYWGWGGEDNDMFWRLKATGLGVTRYSKKIAQYTSLPHNATPVNPYRFTMLETAVYRQKNEGLNSVHYTVVSYQIRHLYTHILIDINPRKENITQIVMSFHKKNRGK